MAAARRAAPLQGSYLVMEEVKGRKTRIRKTGDLEDKMKAEETNMDLKICGYDWKIIGQILLEINGQI